MAENLTAETVPNAPFALTLAVADQAYAVNLPRKTAAIMMQCDSQLRFAYVAVEGSIMVSSHSIAAADILVVPMFKPNDTSERMLFYFESPVAGAVVSVTLLPPEEM